MCRLREIENGLHVPLQKPTVYGAKDLTRTMLSDHLEKRLFKRLMEVKGSENLDKVIQTDKLEISYQFLILNQASKFKIVLK